jgi:hypothetical protein
LDAPSRDPEDAGWLGVHALSAHAITETRAVLMDADYFDRPGLG